jgi:two-component system sensor histidine kinase KdpD
MSSRAPPPAPRRAPLLLGFAWSVATVAAETAVGWLLLDHRLPDIVMLYLFGVVVVAMRFGHAPSLLTAVSSVAAFDFFFTAPYFSFAVDDKRYVLTFAIMLFVAFVISNLTDRVRRTAVAAGERERRTAKLYAMSRELSVAPSVAAIVDTAVRHVRDAFAWGAAMLLLGDDGGLRPATTMAEPTLELDVVMMARVDALFLRGGPEVPGSGCVFATGERVLPLRVSSGVLGALVVRPSVSHGSMSQANLDLLEAFASQIGLAIERARLSEEAQRAQLEIQRERLRNALLSSVSHDLRTPLAVIKGAVTALLEQENDLPPGRHREYLETISGEASRLNRLVRNLLNMTSLEAGTLRVSKEWQPIDDVVGVALNRLEEQLANRPVRVDIDPAASIVAFDATLLEQVLVNLIENATKYTPRGSPIEIRARRTAAGVEVDVSDRGPGVPPGQEAAIFEKFHRATGTPGAAGMGLGLTICRGIVSVHGGRIWCENRAGGGALFRFALPIDGDAPPLSALPEAVGDP